MLDHTTYRTSTELGVIPSLCYPADGGVRVVQFYTCRGQDMGGSV